MNAIPVSEFRAAFSEILNRVAYGHDRVVIRRGGKRLVALVPIADLKLVRELEDEADAREAREAVAESKRLGTIPWSSLKNELEGKGASDARGRG